MACIGDPLKAAWPHVAAVSPDSPVAPGAGYARLKARRAPKGRGPGPVARFSLSSDQTRATGTVPHSLAASPPYPLLALRAPYSVPAALVRARATTPARRGTYAYDDII